MIDVLLPLRAVQLLFTIIALGLSGYLANRFNDVFASGYDTPSEISFMVFVSVWTLLVLPYLALAPTYFPRFAHKYAILALDALTMLFWFASFVAFAVFRNDDILFCRGNRICGTMTAAIVFGAFEWILFTITTVLSALHVFNTRGGSSKPAAHQGVPHGGGGIAAV